MLNEAAVQAVNAARVHEQHLKPMYDSYGFAQIPQTLMHTLTGQGAAGLPDSVWGDLPRRWDKVIVLLIDAFGWDQIQRHADSYPFLRRFFEKGVVSPLSSQFPSTTTAHITTLYTGQPVGVHGLYEWFTYEPLLGRVVIPILTAEVEKDSPRNSLADTGLTGEQLYPLPSFSEALEQAGVAAYVFQPREYLPSLYNDTLCRGATTVPYITISHGLAAVASLVQRVPGPASFYLYYGEIDTLAHHYGPNSPEVDADADTLLTALERLLYVPLAGREDTLIVLTADHGQVAANPDGVILLDRLLPQLAPMIRAAPDGRPIAAAGSPRDVFLHIKPEAIADAYGILKAKMDALGRAEVFTTEDLIAQGYFGELVGPRFRERVGAVVVLSLDDTLIWYGEARQVPKYYGMHGALHPGEMTTHLSIVPTA